MSAKPTKKQLAVLQLHSIGASKKEIADIMGWRNPHGVYDVLNRLCVHGLLEYRYRRHIGCHGQYVLTECGRAVVATLPVLSFKAEAAA